MEQVSQQEYREMAHQLRMDTIQEARSHGCTCHPYVAVALVENPFGELTGLAKLLGHEPRCTKMIEGREN